MKFSHSFFLNLVIFIESLVLRLLLILIRNMASKIHREFHVLFGEIMSPIEPTLHSSPLDTGSMLRNPSTTLDEHGNSDDTRASHHHLWMDSSQKLSKFLRPIETVASDAIAKHVISSLAL